MVHTQDVLKVALLRMYTLQQNTALFTQNYWQQVTMRSHRNCSNCFLCSVLPVVVKSNWR